MKPELPPPRLDRPGRRLAPGYYAVSATPGLRPALAALRPLSAARRWAPVWNAERNAFSYFQQFEPIRRIGHSIYVYKLSQEDVDRATPLLEPRG